mmetsp:Transcript_75944/g.180578  ORF Transcript_75944/g.180578 Transcript_75944/m.180578 type:complete len:206 (-) Transcript_75944:755-1372(-)
MYASTATRGHFKQLRLVVGGQNVIILKSEASLCANGAIKLLVHPHAMLHQSLDVGILQKLAVRVCCHVHLVNSVDIDAWKLHVFVNVQVSCKRLHEDPKAVIGEANKLELAEDVACSRDCIPVNAANLQRVASARNLRIWSIHFIPVVQNVPCHEVVIDFVSLQALDETSLGVIDPLDHGGCDTWYLLCAIIEHKRGLQKLHGFA